MNKKKSDEKEPKIRQCVLVSLNESVTLLSSYDGESMDYLSKKAMSLLKRIQKKDAGKHE